MFGDAQKGILEEAELIRQQEELEATLDVKQKKMSGFIPYDRKVSIMKQFCDLYCKGIYTHDSICKAIGVNGDTLRTWVKPTFNYKAHPPESYPTGFLLPLREMYDASILEGEQRFMNLLKERTRKGMIERISGYNFEEVTTEVKRDADGNAKPVSVKKTSKHVPPDSTLLIFAAKCLDGDYFKDKQITEHTGAVTMRNEFAALPDDELFVLEEKLKKQLTSND